MTVLQGIATSSSVSNKVLATGSQDTVPSSALTTILSYTNSSGGIERVNHIIASGTSYAKFTLVIDTVIVSTLRSGPNRNVTFYPNIELANGSIVDIKVEHFNSAQQDNFEATIFGF